MSGINTYRIKQDNVDSECEIIHIGNISLTLDYLTFYSGSNEEIGEFIEGQMNLVLANLLQNYSKVRIDMSCLCDMLKENGEVDENVRVNIDPATIYRHEASRHRTLRNLLLKLFNPKEYQDMYGEVNLEGDTSGSQFSVVDKIISVTCNFVTPLEYIANALSSSYKPTRGHMLTRYMKIPRNKDYYCFLHCLRTSLKIKEDFGEWFDRHNMGRFYEENLFYMDLVPEIEDELKTSINIYNRTGDEEIDLYYRSSYKYPETITNILIVSLRYFQTKKGKLADTEEITISSTKDHVDGNFLARSNFFEFMNTERAHAVILNPNWFSKVTKKDGTINKSKSKTVCRYCTNVCNKKALENHELNCLAYHQQTDSKSRVRNFVETKHPKKEFKAYKAQYQIPFATYDFETRLDENKKHIPFSYAIMYMNIFEPEKSIIKMNSQQDPVQLIKDFMRDCKEITVHHHDDIQCEDLAIDKPILSEEERAKGCPWCLREYALKNPPEYNHSHFKNDNLNTKHNRYICMDCNRKCMIRNQPLKFYGHNATRYDHNLFMTEFLNDPSTMNHAFINKNESRFSEVKFGFTTGARGELTFDHFWRPIAKYKLSFNDSRLLLSSSLSSLAGAWINKKSAEDTKTLNTFLKLHYGERLNQESIDNIREQSFKKQMFPYDALSHEHLLKEKENIDISYFRNTFTDTDCTPKDYQTYLDANDVLSKNITDYTFQDYHDYYLLLDVVLLSMILRNFQKACHEMSNLNPLMFLSTSSYSFSSLLYNNKYSENNLPTIVLPKVDVGRFVKRSVHGGFTHIFNRKNLRGEDDYTMYTDYTSLYPSVMSQCKLPYEFKEWLDLSQFQSQADMIKYMEENDYYYFIEADIKALDTKYHKSVSMLPLFPESQVVTPDQYSENQRLRYKLNNKSALKDNKINTVTFYAKKNYIASWTYYKEALAVGYEWDTVHKIAVFKQDFILKEYIDKIYDEKLNLTVEKNDLIRNGDKQGRISTVLARLIVVKLILNAIYGFCLVNVENHSEATLLDLTPENSVKIKKQASSLRFKSMIKVGDRIVMNRMKTTYSFDYPMHIGSAILFESKLLMIKYIYNLQKWLPTVSNELEVHPCFTDTDSYCLSIKNFKKHFKSIDEYSYRFNREAYPLFDTSFNTKEYQMPETHSKLGFMTNETNNVEITEWYGIACKAYTYKVADNEIRVEGGTKGKGISGALQAQCLNYELYESIVNGSILENYKKADYSVGYSDFKTSKFNVNTVSINKCYATLVDLKTYCGENSEYNFILGSEDHLAAIAK